MELWIRSQDKERLIRVGNLYAEYNGDVEPNIHTYRIVTDKFIEIGTYKSKERALEVLDEIQNILIPPVAIYMNKGYGKETMQDVLNEGIVCVRDNGEVKKLYDTYVYQMPEE